MIPGRDNSFSYLDGCGDWVDVDQLLHVALIRVPKVVLTSHAECSNKYKSELNRKKKLISDEDILLRTEPAIGEVTIA